MIIVFFDNVTQKELLDIVRTNKKYCPMLAECWLSICYVGPILKQHWLNVSCCLTRLYRVTKHIMRSLRPVKSTRRTNAGLMLGHRLRRWSKINPALIHRVLFSVQGSCVSSQLLPGFSGPPSGVLCHVAYK